MHQILWFLIIVTYLSLTSECVYNTRLLKNFIEYNVGYYLFFMQMSYFFCERLKKEVLLAAGYICSNLYE
jgi:hypothetical protein